jgi:hypothetical protein
MYPNSIAINKTDRTFKAFSNVVIGMDKIGRLFNFISSSPVTVIYYTLSQVNWSKFPIILRNSSKLKLL